MHNYDGSVRNKASPSDNDWLMFWSDWLENLPICLDLNFVVDLIYRSWNQFNGTVEPA